MAQTLHVFSGTFGSRERACQYSEQQWEKPAPDDSWSEQDYAAWEARNPKWLLRQHLAVALLDPDFIETIFGSHKIEYLRSQLATKPDKHKLPDQIPQEADTLVLIMSQAFRGHEVRLSSTPRLKYHGEYAWSSGA